MKKHIAVIGAGLSGITIASIIKEKFKVEVFEKSRGVGGRMSTRKELPFIFDHGAQFFKIESNDFKNFVAELIAQQIISPWKLKLAYFEGDNLKKIKMIQKKHKFYVGVPSMDSIVKYMSKDLCVNLNTKIERIIKQGDKWYIYDQNKKRHGHYDWIIISLPAEQSLELIAKTICFHSLIKKIKMVGCISLMVGLNKSLNLDYDAALIKNKDIAWLALNNSKPHRKKNTCLLINSSYEYAKKNSNSSKIKVQKHLLNETRNLINSNLSDAELLKVHQWKYVEAKNHPAEDYFIDRDQKIGVCGDWFINSRVEGAFLSAKKLSNEIL